MIFSFIQNLNSYFDFLSLDSESRTCKTETAKNSEMKYDKIESNIKISIQNNEETNNFKQPLDQNKPNRSHSNIIKVEDFLKTNNSLIKQEKKEQPIVKSNLNISSFKKGKI